nr:MAG TPA: hypothetical protein [Caudoviricetes sp.]
MFLMSKLVNILFSFFCICNKNSGKKPKKTKKKHIAQVKRPKEAYDEVRESEILRYMHRYG